MIRRDAGKEIGADGQYPLARCALFVISVAIDQQYLEWETRHGGMGLQHRLGYADST